MLLEEVYLRTFRVRRRWAIATRGLSVDDGVPLVKKAQELVLCCCMFKLREAAWKRSETVTAFMYRWAGVWCARGMANVGKQGELKRGGHQSGCLAMRECVSVYLSRHPEGIPAVRCREHESELCRLQHQTRPLPIARLCCPFVIDHVLFLVVFFGMHGCHGAPRHRSIAAR